MTKQIHDGVRKHRRWVVAVGAAMALAAALIFLVIPAFGSPAGSQVPPACLQLGWERADSLCKPEDRGDQLHDRWRRGNRHPDHESREHGLPEDDRSRV